MTSTRGGELGRLELPEAALAQANWIGGDIAYYYTADQMFSYARAALRAQLARRDEAEPVAWRFWITDSSMGLKPYWTLWSSDAWFRDTSLKAGYRVEYAYAAPKRDEVAGVVDRWRIQGDHKGGFRVVRDEQGAWVRYDDLAPKGGEGWVSVAERLPEKEGCYLCVVRQEGSRVPGYVDTVCYGSYEFFSEVDNPHLQPGETYDANEGQISGHGWHNEEETHGGEYDYIVVIYREGASRGYVSHWMPRPELPASLLAAAAPPSAESQP